MSYKFIETYSDFILNETLKTHDIDLTIENVENELSLMRYNFSIKKNKNNKIELRLIGFRYIQLLDITLKHINSLFIDRHGWFPSQMKLKNISGKMNILSYDENYLHTNIQLLEEVIIIYESKYDKKMNIPNKLYHLSIQEYKVNILKNGLIPKSKSKLSKHLDRIYLCENVDYCYLLIPKMTADYIFKMNNKYKINIKWIIYEIDTKDINIELYQDPNYSFGMYCVDNISKERIKIFDEEK